MYHNMMKDIISKVNDTEIILGMLEVLDPDGGPCKSFDLC